ncbi:hypothetical protein CI793_12330, partial [Anoxybacillus ayderensis]
MTFFVACEKEYQKHQTFSSVDEMNWHIAEMKKRVHFTPAELRILDVMVKHSCKVIGACWLKKENIMKLAHVESEITLRRFFKKMQNHGFMKIYRTYRAKKGGQSSNIYEFQKVFSENCLGGLSRRENAENADISKDKAVKNKTETTILETKVNNINNVIEGQNEPILDSSFVPGFVDENFVRTAAPFFNAKEIYHFWLRVLIAYKKSKLQRPIGEVIGTVNKAFKHTVFMYKQGRIEKSFEGYFYRLVESYLFTERCRERQ